MSRSTLSKTREQIKKKRNGDITALHQNSRDARRLHRAQIRDEKLEKIASRRKKIEHTKLERVKFFQQAIRDNDTIPLELEALQKKINQFVTSVFVCRHDEELLALTQARRHGRPPSMQEDRLKLKAADLKAEYEKGFLLPNLMSGENVNMLDRWDGEWAYLNQMSWIKVAQDGSVKPATWGQDNSVYELFSIRFSDRGTARPGSEARNRTEALKPLSARTTPKDLDVSNQNKM